MFIVSSIGLNYLIICFIDLAKNTLESDEVERMIASGINVEIVIDKKK